MNLFESIYKVKSELDLADNFNKHFTNIGTCHIDLKVRDHITFLTPQLTSKFLRFWYQ